MAGILPSELQEILGALSPDDILMVQKNGEGEVKKITFSNLLKKGEADGVCPLNGLGVIPDQFLPNLSITDVYVVSTISERDSLVVQKGDVVKVTNSDGNGHPNTYIWDGSSYVDIQESSDVISVNGKTGEVVLTTADINDSTNRRYVTDTEFAI